MSDYAPQYTAEEKKAIILKVALVLFVSCLFLVFVEFSWIHGSFQDTCSFINNFEKTKYILYIGLVLMPGVLCLATVFVFGPKALKMMKLGQYPLPGDKVFVPTKYKYGRPVHIRAVFLLILLVGLAVMPLGLVYATNKIVVLIEANIGELHKKCG